MMTLAAKGSMARYSPFNGSLQRSSWRLAMSLEEIVPHLRLQKRSTKSGQSEPASFGIFENNILGQRHVLVEVVSDLSGSSPSGEHAARHRA